LIEGEGLRFSITAALSAATACCASRAGSKSPMVVRVNCGRHVRVSGGMIAVGHNTHRPR